MLLNSCALLYRVGSISFVFTFIFRVSGFALGLLVVLGSKHVLCAPQQEPDPWLQVRFSILAPFFDAGVLLTN